MAWTSPRSVIGCTAFAWQANVLSFYSVLSHHHTPIYWTCSQSMPRVMFHAWIKQQILNFEALLTSKERRRNLKIGTVTIILSTPHQSRLFRLSHPSILSCYFNVWESAENDSKWNPNHAKHQDKQKSSEEVLTATNVCCPSHFVVRRLRIWHRAIIFTHSIQLGCPLPWNSDQEQAFYQPSLARVNE